METYLLQKQNGTFDLRPLINWLSYAKDGVYKIDVRLIRKQRTLDQNRWLWGCVYPLLRQALNAQGWEFTEDEQVHEFFKQQMASDKVVNRHTGEIIEIPGSTREMDTVTLSTHCTKLTDHRKQDNGVGKTEAVK